MLAGMVNNQVTNGGGGRQRKKRVRGLSMEVTSVDGVGWKLTSEPGKYRDMAGLYCMCSNE